MQCTNYIYYHTNYWSLIIFITKWRGRGITCGMAVNEGTENAYLPRKVQFPISALSDIGIAMVAGTIRNASRWLD